MLYLHHPSSLEHDPREFMPEHPDVPERIAAIETALAGVGWDGCDRRLAPAASAAELALVHTSAHITKIAELCECGGGQLDDDTFIGERSYAAALHAAGGACAMVRALLAGDHDVGFSMLRPSGHHAERARPMGFCIFNNVAIAAELAIRELGASRVLILDWDVHHGNGTAEIFRYRDDVLYASIHQQGLFPGTGPLADVGSGRGNGYTINIPVPAGSGDDAWLSVLEYVVVPAATAFAPELILISAGFDAHRADPLADCRLESSSFGQMACQIRDLAATLNSPVGAVLEGGYDLPSLSESVLATIAALNGAGESTMIAPDQIVTPRALSQVARSWDI